MLLAQHGRRGEEPPAHPEPRAGTALRSPLAVRRGTERRGGSVSGIVKDPNGQPVLGVTVVVPGTTRGTTTDARRPLHDRSRDGRNLELQLYRV